MWANQCSSEMPLEEALLKTCPRQKARITGWVGLLVSLDLADVADIRELGSIEFERLAVTPLLLTALRLIRESGTDIPDEAKASQGEQGVPVQVMPAFPTNVPTVVGFIPSGSYGSKVICRDLETLRAQFPDLSVVCGSSKNVLGKIREFIRAHDAPGATMNIIINGHGSSRYEEVYRHHRCFTFVNDQQGIVDETGIPFDFNDFQCYCLAMTRNMDLTFNLLSNSCYNYNWAKFVQGWKNTRKLVYFANTSAANAVTYFNASGSLVFQHPLWHTSEQLSAAQFSVTTNQQ